jgi:50S ribosomal subunit-associated GTPase HflX
VHATNALQREIILLISIPTINQQTTKHLMPTQRRNQNSTSSRGHRFFVRGAGEAEQSKRRRAARQIMLAARVRRQALRAAHG